MQDTPRKGMGESLSSASSNSQGSLTTPVTLSVTKKMKSFSPKVGIWVVCTWQPLQLVMLAVPIWWILSFKSMISAFKND